MVDSKSPNKWSHEMVTHTVVWSERLGAIGVGVSEQMLRFRFYLGASFSSNYIISDTQVYGIKK